MLFRSIDNTLPGAPVYPGHGLPGAPVDPGFGSGWGGPHPGHGLPPSPGHPGNVLPPPGSIATLPVFPFDPTKPVDPEEPPATSKPIVPGRKFVVKWLACHGLILVPDNTLPETEPTPTPTA